MNFELIFRNNISEYIDKIISKIKTISNFYNIIKLINLKNIEDLGKIDIYLNFLNKKYENSIRNEIIVFQEIELPFFGSQKRGLTSKLIYMNAHTLQIFNFLKKSKGLPYLVFLLF